jgi:ribose transport system substrate-binding protein
MARRPNHGARIAAASSTLILMAAVAAGCGSSSSTSSNAAATSAGTSSVGSSDSAAQASKRAAAAEQLPASTELTQPLSKTPPAGKRIVYLECAQPVCVAYQKGFKAAAAALKWNVTTVSFGATPESIQSALNSAIQNHPDGIATAGVDDAVIAPQLKQLQAKGIPLVAAASVSAVKPPTIAVMITPAGPDYAARAADWMAADSNGKAQAVVVNLPLFASLTQTTQAFNKEVAQVCAGCKTTQLAAAPTDVGTQLPSKVVSALQQAPATNYVAFAFGDMMTGVPAALKGAGLNVKLLGYGSASPPTVADVQAGNVAATTCWSTEYTTWRIMDAFARHFVGDSVAKDTSAPWPYMLLTKANVATAAPSPSIPNWDYCAPPNYQADFKQLWHVS